MNKKLFTGITIFTLICLTTLMLCSTAVAASTAMNDANKITIAAQAGEEEVAMVVQGQANLIENAVIHKKTIAQVKSEAANFNVIAKKNQQRVNSAATICFNSGAMMKNSGKLWLARSNC